MTEPDQGPDLWPGTPWSDHPAIDQNRNESDLPPSSRSLRKSGVILLIASTVVLFLSAIASGNAAANTPAEQISLGVHRISMVAMLISFITILVAYRLPSLLTYLESRPVAASKPELNSRIFTQPLRFLLKASCILIIWVWCVILIGSPVLHQVTLWALFILAGLLANMIILHRGCVRSFAIGTLITMVLVLLTWRSLHPMLMANQGSFGFPGGPDFRMIYVSYGMEVTLSLVSGLLCACYHNFVASIRARTEQLPTTTT
jgi:hypothetical protein